MMPTGPIEPPLVFRTLDEMVEPPQHRDFVCAYSTRQRPWRCAGCGAFQKPHVWRYWRHCPEACGREEASGCYHGPICPHCAEVPIV